MVSLKNVIELNSSLFEAVVELCNAREFNEVRDKWRRALAELLDMTEKKLTNLINSETVEAANTLRDKEVQVQGGM